MTSSGNNFRYYLPESLISIFNEKYARPPCLLPLFFPIRLSALAVAWPVLLKLLGPQLAGQVAWVNLSATTSRYPRLVFTACGLQALT